MVRRGMRSLLETEADFSVVGEGGSIVYTATVDGTWPRLKACRREICHWLFYDHSRNRSGIWCSMAVCGNRTKTRAYRERREATRS